MRKFSAFLISSIFLATYMPFTLITAFAETLHVPESYSTIQEAINAAKNGDIILVAASIYNEDITLKSGVTLIGDGADKTIIRGTGAGPVVTAIDVASNAKISGFTITGGRAEKGGGIYCSKSYLTISYNRITGNSALEDYGGGGGIYCYFSSPQILHNEITENRAESKKAHGGAIYCYNSSPTISDNRIIGNISQGSAGGIICANNSSPTISNNTISKNIAVESHAGGIRCIRQSSPKISNNIITENRAKNLGGGILCDWNSSPKILHNLIAGNIAGSGGGIACAFYSFPVISDNAITENISNEWGGGGITCTDNSDPTITNNIISRNKGNTETYAYFNGGGGIFCSRSSSPVISNNIIRENSTDLHGGAIYCDQSSPFILNNVVVENSTSRNGGGIACTRAASPTIVNSIIWGNGDDLHSCSASYSCIEDYDDGTGNIHSDPMFVDAAIGNYHLQEDSPCIDSGKNGAFGLPKTDFNGNPRILDGDNDRKAIVDMGVYELQYVF